MANCEYRIADGEFANGELLLNFLNFLNLLNLLNFHYSPQVLTQKPKLKFLNIFQAIKFLVAIKIDCI
jgi:hypothetical protein